MNGMRWLKMLMRQRARKNAEAHAGEAFRYVSLRFKGEEEIPDDLQFSVAEDAPETEKKDAAASEKSRPKVSYSLRDQPKDEQERDGKHRNGISQNEICSCHSCCAKTHQ